MNMHILKTELSASSGAKKCENYRAVIKRGKLGALLQVQQPIKGEWHPTGGGWYLTTLLENPNDGISIDFGQQWQVDHGMIAAIDEACIYLAGEFTE